MRLCHWALLLAIAPSAIPARAETCKYVDEEGRVIYSNTPNNPPKDAKMVKCFSDPAPTTPAPQVSKPQSGAREGFPKVDGQTQKKRDDERRRILEKELADEQQRLEAARQKLAEQEAIRTGDERNYQRFLDRIQPFRDAVANHERNIEAISREISNLR
ncbi:MAG TPA: DUF4124 domain-containing protein [Burkholderiales bacterium]|jgi:hypothetical protein|nr:DUF4124 domain-containing protein [Burkholderiales bacterium]